MQGKLRFLAERKEARKKKKKENTEQSPAKSWIGFDEIQL